MEEIKTVLSACNTAIFLVGGIVAFVQLRETYRLRRLQVLSSFNERLGYCIKATTWIEQTSRKWTDLDHETRFDFENYVSTFEDIGLAREIGIVSRDDFIRSYGGRFKQFVDSGRFFEYVKDAGYEAKNFENLVILLKDIGRYNSEFFR